MSFITKLFNLWDVTTEPYDSTKDNRKTIVIDKDAKEVYVEGERFICHNNDDAEDALVAELESKYDILASMVEGLNEQIAEIQEAISKNGEQDSLNIVKVNNNSLELQQLEESFEKLSSILVNNSKRLDSLDEWKNTIDDEWKNTIEEMELSKEKKIILND